MYSRWCINFPSIRTWSAPIRLRTVSVGSVAVAIWISRHSLFDDRDYFDGLRVLATNQIDKPILNIFRMFGKLTGQRVTASSGGQVSLDDILAHSVRGESDIGVIAAYNTTTRALSAMIWNYHDDDLPKPDAQITLDVSGLAQHWDGCQAARATHYRIDNSHSNSYTRWLEMEAPQHPTDAQVAELKAAGQLQMLGEPVHVPVRDGKVEIEFALPIHGTSLLVLEEQ